MEGFSTDLSSKLQTAPLPSRVGEQGHVSEAEGYGEEEKKGEKEVDGNI